MVKKILGIVLAGSVVLSCNLSVLANDNKTPEYYCSSIYSEYGMEDGYIYTFADGEIMPNDSPVLMINGSFTSKVQPIIVNNYALIPVRSVAEYLGAEVHWNGSTQEIFVNYLNNESYYIKFNIGSTLAYINGSTVELDSAPILVEGTAYVPLRFIAEAMGKEVVYIPPANFTEGKGNYLNNIQIGVAYNPVIAIYDNSRSGKNTKTADEVIAWLRPKLLESYYRQLAQEINISDPNIKQEYDFILDNINNLSYLGYMDSYFIFKGAYLTLVDIANDKVYFVGFAHGLGTIYEADFLNDTVFLPMYLTD